MKNRKIFFYYARIESEWIIYNLQNIIYSFRFFFSGHLLLDVNIAQCIIYFMISNNGRRKKKQQYNEQ